MCRRLPLLVTLLVVYKRELMGNVESAASLV